KRRGDGLVARDGSVEIAVVVSDHAKARAHEHRVGIDLVAATRHEYFEQSASPAEVAAIELGEGEMADSDQLGASIARSTRDVVSVGEALLRGVERSFLAIEQSEITQRRSLELAIADHAMELQRVLEARTRARQLAVAECQRALVAHDLAGQSVSAGDARVDQRGREVVRGLTKAATPAQHVTS